MTLPIAAETPGDPYMYIVGTGIERAVQLANRTVQSESSAVTINPERVVRATVKIVKKRPRTVRTIVTQILVSDCHETLWTCLFHQDSP